VWRLDTDSFLLGTAAADPFAQMAATNATYGWVHACRRMVKVAVLARPELASTGSSVCI